MDLPERNFGKILSNVISITYNKGGNPAKNVDKDPFANEMNAGMVNVIYIMLIQRLGWES